MQTVDCLGEALRGQGTDPSQLKLALDVGGTLGFSAPGRGSMKLKGYQDEEEQAVLAGLADLVDDAEAATAPLFMSLDDGRLEAAMVAASREVRVAGAAERAGGRPAATWLAAAVGVYRAAAAAIDSRLPAIADTHRAIAAAWAP
jgi:hypothetical protein